MANDFRCRNCGCKIDTKHLKIGDILVCEKCKADKELPGFIKANGGEPKGREIPKVIAVLIPIAVLFFYMNFRIGVGTILNELFYSIFGTKPQNLRRMVRVFTQVPGTIVLLYFYVNGLSRYLIGFGPEKVKFNPKPIRKAFLQGVIAICLFEVLLYILG